MLDRTIQPEIHEIPFPSILPIEKRVLSNGAELYILRGGTQEIVSLDIITKSGVLYSDAAGVARAASSLLGEGAGSFTSKDIANKFDFYGINVSGSTSLTTSELSIVGLTRYMDKCLDEVEAMIKQPLFPQQELDLYKERLKHKYMLMQKKTKSRAAQIGRKMLYAPDCRYSRSISFEIIDSMSRDMLADFHAKTYHSEGAKIFVSGQPDDRLLARIEEIFGDTWERKEPIDIDLYPKYNDEVKTYFDNVDDATQNSIYMTTKMPTIGHPDSMVLDVLNVIFGGYFGSRLMANIREEKGLTYGIGSAYNINRLHAEHIIATNVNIDMYETVIDEIWKEMERLCTEPVPQEELDVVKSYMRGSYLQRFDSVLAQGEAYKSLFLNGYDMELYRRQYEVLNNVTPEELLQMAQKYYKRENYHVIISGKK